MFDYNSFKQKSPHERFLFILGLVMFCLYLFLGVSLIFWKEFPLALAIKPLYRIALGALLIIYAAIRFFRLIKTDEE
jgi:hypothetical protein